MPGFVLARRDPLHCLGAKAADHILIAAAPVGHDHDVVGQPQLPASQPRQAANSSPARRMKPATKVEAGVS